MTKIFHLVYRSHSISDLTKNDIKNIIAKSQNNNTKLGLTGLLIYRQNTFIQLLEGDEQTVRDAYAKIAKDSRHFNVKTLIESKSSMRIVPLWSMTYVESSSDQTSVQSLFEVFDKMIDENPQDKSLIMPLLTKFSNVNV